MENNVIATIATCLDALRINTKEVLTQEEAAMYTGLSVNTLYNLVSRREIPHYKKGSKSYFKRKEIEEWMTSDKRYSDEENKQRAEAYVRKKKTL